MLFFTGEKEYHVSYVVKPTTPLAVRSLGYSYIMHSRRVGALNLFLASSAYLGLTNSGMTPLVLSRLATYSASLKTRVLVLPGK
jgi:hypothetical protein